MATVTPRFKFQTPLGFRPSLGLEKLEHRQISADDYKKKLKLAQLDLLKWQRMIAETKSTVVIVIEGPDAAGKGGAIKRITEKLDPRLLKVHSIVKPSLEEIKLAFSFLDIDKSGQVSLANLKKRLGVFFPDMTAKEYKFLMNNRKELTIEDLSEFLAENEISDPDFDPIAEAFKVKNKGKNCLARALFLVE